MSVGEFWPERFVQSAVWSKQFRQNSNDALSGSVVVTDHGEPFWRVEFSVEVPIRTVFVNKWEAFLARREGAKNTFTMNRPFQYSPARSPVVDDTNLIVQSVSRTNSTVTFAGVEPDYIAGEGDMIGYFTERSGFYVATVLADAVSVDGSVTMKVWPAPFGPHPDTPNPRRRKALGEFKLESERPVENISTRSWRVVAIQEVRG